MASCTSSGTAEAWGLRREDGPGAKMVEAGMLGGGLRLLGLRDLTCRRWRGKVVQGSRLLEGVDGQTVDGRAGRVQARAKVGRGTGPQYVMPIEMVGRTLVYHIQ